MDRPTSATTDVPATVDIHTPHPARVYDYWLGGKDNYAADRAAAAAISEQLPGVAGMVRALYRFAQRAVRLQVTGFGVRQFVVLGAGIPTGNATHRTAQALEPTARIVYVNPDPIVAAHTRALLSGHPRGRVEFVQASTSDLSALLDDPELTRVIDLSAPVSFNTGLGLSGCSDEEVTAVLGLLGRTVVPGSCLVAAHATADFDPAGVAGANEVGSVAGVAQGLRSHAGFSRFFDGWELVEPGVVPVVTWRPDADEPVTDPQEVSVYGGLARKP